MLVGLLAGPLAWGLGMYPACPALLLSLFASTPRLECWRMAPRPASAHHQPHIPLSALHRRGKLCLVLDLDHTLLNSARYAEVDPELQRELERRIEQEALLPAEERLLFKVEEIKVGTWFHA